MAIAVYVSVATVISIIPNKAGQLIRKTYHISDGAQVSISTMHSRFTLESKMKHRLFIWSRKRVSVKRRAVHFQKEKITKKALSIEWCKSSIGDKTKPALLTWFNYNEYSLPFLLQCPPLHEVLHHPQDPVKYKAKSYLIFQTLHGRRFERNSRKFHTGWMNLQIYLFSLRSS